VLEKRTNSETTDSAAVKRQMHALRSLEQFAESAAGKDSNILTVLGVSRKTMQARVASLKSTTVRNDKLKRFQALSKTKVQHVITESSRRRLGMQPYAQPQLRLGKLFQNTSTVDPSATNRSVLNATPSPVAVKPHWQIKDATGLSVAGTKAIWDRISSVNFVIVEKLADVTTLSTNATMWIVAFSIIAMGKSAVSRSGFVQNARPERCALCVHHQVSARCVTCRIGLGKTFVEKHRGMRLMFELATKVDKSSWSVCILHSDCRNKADIDHFVLSEEDAWHFLHKVRRLARRGGLWDGAPTGQQ
jgi:hypothetical protein